jgi:hypothetical protein
MRSVLSNKDMAGADTLSAEHLYAQALRLAIATIPARTATFFMGHG